MSETIIFPPNFETCPKCGQEIVIVTLPQPAGNTSDCLEADCPMKAKYHQRYDPLEDDQPPFAHQLTFNTDED